MTMAFLPWPTSTYKGEINVRSFELNKLPRAHTNFSENRNFYNVEKVTKEELCQSV